jgi:hypothetical protein
MLVLGWSHQIRYKEVRLRMKTVGKIFGFSSPDFYIFIISILFMKYGKLYKNGIGCCGNRSGYG